MGWNFEERLDIPEPAEFFEKISCRRSKQQTTQDLLEQ